jgi:hypothetical protein
LAPHELRGPVWREIVDFRFGGELFRQDQEYFVALVEPTPIAPTALTQPERNAWRGSRWWSAVEIEESPERIYPTGLAELLRSTGTVP